MAVQILFLCIASARKDVSLALLLSVRELFSFRILAGIGKPSFSAFLVESPKKWFCLSTAPFLCLPFAGQIPQLRGTGLAAKTQLRLCLKDTGGKNTSFSLRCVSNGDWVLYGLPKGEISFVSSVTVFFLFPRI